MSHRARESSLCARIFVTSRQEDPVRVAILLSDGISDVERRRCVSRRFLSAFRTNSSNSRTAGVLTIACRRFAASGGSFNQAQDETCLDSDEKGTWAKGMTARPRAGHPG